MAETRKAFVCGHPIAHSRSPLIHGYWLDLYGIEGTYERIDVAPEDFAAFLRTLPQSGYAGGNVTLPYKEAAAALVDRLQPAAEMIGAVNTVWVEDGALVGDNTDAYGFSANLDACAPGWSECRVATILGAGGAARAIVHALKERGLPEIRVVNRTRSRAGELADRFGAGVSAHEWQAVGELLSDTGLLINTTQLGMAGQPSLEIDVSRLPAHAGVADIVYVPLQTDLLKQAGMRGLRAVAGLGMLLHQAVPGFERWFARRPEVSAELHRLVEADVGTVS